MNYNNYDNQYSTTSYGAQGGGGGGGFMTGGSQTSPGGNKGRPADTLRPVTIKQLLDAEPNDGGDADFKIDGTEITQVTFVAQIRNISNQTTNNTYKLDDGTGTIEAKQWVDSDANVNGDAVNGTSAKLGEQVYVRVFGKLKSFNNKRHVGATIIRPIQDKNEIQYHLLESTVVHLFFTRGPPGAQKTERAGETNGMNGGFNVPAFKGDGLEAKVYEVIRTSPQSNEGLHLQTIASRLQESDHDVLAAASNLLDQGKIYTTVDDYTWAILIV